MGVGFLVILILAILADGTGSVDFPSQRLDKISDDTFVDCSGDRDVALVESGTTMLHAFDRTRHCALAKPNRYDAFAEAMVGATGPAHVTRHRSMPIARPPARNVALQYAETPAAARDR